MGQHRDRAIALAAIFQAVDGVHALARNGQTDPAALRTAVHSTVTRDANDSADFFGGLGELSKGLDMLQRVLTQRIPDEEMILTRYAVAVLHVAKKLRKKPALMETLSQGIDKAERSVAHFGEDHENVFASLADTYSETAGQIHPRIMVSGNDHHLQNPRVVNMIRTLLLGSIRAAVLWYQSGGSRWNLIFGRRTLADEATALSEQLAAPAGSD